MTPIPIDKESRIWFVVGMFWRFDKKRLQAWDLVSLCYYITNRNHSARTFERRTHNSFLWRLWREGLFTLLCNKGIAQLDFSPNFRKQLFNESFLRRVQERIMMQSDNFRDKSVWLDESWDFNRFIDCNYIKCLRAFGKSEATTHRISTKEESVLLRFH